MVCLVAAVFALSPHAHVWANYEGTATTQKLVPTTDALDVVYNGSYSQRISFKLPEQRGLEPQLGLSYNSGRATLYGPTSLVGAGWRLTGLSTIQRASFRKAVPAFDSNDVWLLDGQELVPCGTGTRAGCGAGGTHATWVENYQRIKQIPESNTWKITTRDGTQFVYKPLEVWAAPETVPLSGDAATETLTQYRYLLAEKVNTKGQAVTYTYDCGADLDCRISTISYDIGEINFHWETRPDLVTYAAGHMLGKSAHRLRTVEIRAAGQMLRTYELHFDASPATGRSLLASVTERGRDSMVAADGSVASGTEMPSHTFHYTGAAPAPNRVADGQSHEFDSGSGCIGSCSSNLRAKAYGSIKDDHSLYPITIEAYESRRYVSSQDGYVSTYYCKVKALGETVNSWESDYHSGNAHHYSCPIKNVNFYFLKTSHSLARSYFYNYDKRSCREVGGDYVSCTWSRTTNANRGEPDVVGDFNGDGLDDTIDIGSKVVLSNGGRSWGNIRSLGFKAADVNGDGLDDHFHTDQTTFQVRYSNGSTGFESAAFSVALPNMYHTFTALGDFNGDGTKDILRAIDNSGTYRISYVVGKTVVDGPDFKLPGSCVNGDSCSKPNPLDVNSDGRADIIVSGYYGNRNNYAPDTDGQRDGKVFLNSASGFTLVERSAGSSYTFNGAAGGVQDADWDGLLEIALDTNDEIDGTGPQRWRVVAEKPDLLDFVKTPFGAEMAVTYAYHKPVDQIDMPLKLFVVSSIETFDGRSVRAVTDYAYEGAKWDWEEWLFLGFEKITATLPLNEGETGRPVVETTYLQDFASIGKVSQVLRKDGSGNELHKRVETHDVHMDELPYWSLNTETRLTDFFEGTAREKREVREFDDFGLVTRTVSYGDTAAVGGERDLVRQSYPNTDKYIVDRWASETVNALSGDGTVESQAWKRWHYYDGANTVATQPPVEGYRTQTSEWTGGAADDKVAQSVAVYDAYGNLSSETDALGNTSTYVYDTSYALFPEEVRNPRYAFDSRQKKTLTWDKVCSVVLSETDENGSVTSHSYDPLCRKVQTDLPLGGRITFEYNNWGDPSASHNRTSTLHPNGFEDITTDAYFDGFGRTYLEESSTARQFAGVGNDGRDTTARNSPVVVNPIADHELVQGVFWQFTVPGSTFMDGNFDALSYSAHQTSGTALPAWLSFDGNSQTFAGTPPADMTGTLSISVLASDGTGVAEDVFKISVVSPNAPTVANMLSDQTVAADVIWSFSVPEDTFVDPNQDTLTYTASLASGAALPSWLTFNPATRTFTSTSQNQPVALKVSASDGVSTASDTFDLSIGDEEFRTQLQGGIKAYLSLGILTLQSDTTGPITESRDSSQTPVWVTILGGNATIVSLEDNGGKVCKFKYVDIDQSRMVITRPNGSVDYEDWSDLSEQEHAEQICPGADSMIIITDPPSGGRPPDRA